MSPWHWALVIAVGILLFGAKRLPEAARSLGRSARILKAELGGTHEPAPTTSTTDGAGAPPTDPPARPHGS
ncbi:Sec-independent protein translocase subunit TatA [Pseudonocardia sp. KRD291]|uniref:Sec-independent protein translocase subunit TatA n=1 Tax=Pseudonocardia sp. KRD291 TaxID=2792007 RepID=UPI001CF7CF06|nr:Sec-independent protein translocase subunit TatA [Pseudonocardia sp. KRD291]